MRQKINRNRKDPMQISQTATEVTRAGAPPAGVTMEAMEFLAFRLDKEEYGINMLKVQEIRGYDAVTRIANAPDYPKG
jgi:purine-binding chemotaxis protein CheW